MEPCVFGLQFLYTQLFNYVTKRLLYSFDLIKHLFMLFFFFNEKKTISHKFTFASVLHSCSWTEVLHMHCRSSAEVSKKIKAGLPSRKQLYYFEYVCETDVGCVVVCFFKHCRYDCLKSCETSLRVLEKHIHFRQVLAGVDTRCVSDHMALYPTPNMFQCTRVSR